MDPDRPDHRDPQTPDRRHLLPRDGGRRQTDRVIDARADLEQLAAIADAKGRRLIVAVCRKALTQIAALEAELQRCRGNAQRGAQTRLATLTGAERSRIAKIAAQRRWHPHASG